jgi:hypothetical protein
MRPSRGDAAGTTWEMHGFLTQLIDFDESFEVGLQAMARGFAETSTSAENLLRVLFRLGPPVRRCAVGHFGSSAVDAMCKQCVHTSASTDKPII